MALGDKAASCARSGRLKLRSRPLEKAWARILREAGARVKENFAIRDAGIADIDPRDGRRVEVVASGLPVEHGVPVAVDATLISPLRGDGVPHGRAAAQIAAAGSANRGCA